MVLITIFTHHYLQASNIIRVNIALDADVSTIVDAFLVKSPGVERESTLLKKLRQPYSVGYQGAGALDERIASQGLDSVCETFNRRRTIRSFVERVQEYETFFIVIVLPPQRPTIVDSLSWARELHYRLRMCHENPFEPDTHVPRVRREIIDIFNRRGDCDLDTLFVRVEYDRAWTSIEKRKTMFLIFCLLKALRTRTTVAFSIAPDEVILFKAGSVELCSHFLDVPTDALALLDARMGPIHHVGAIQSRAVIATSEWATLKKFQKYMDTLGWIMPVWTSKELGWFGPGKKGYWSVVELASVLGPCPRVCLEPIRKVSGNILLDIGDHFPKLTVPVDMRVGLDAFLDEKSCPLCPMDGFHSFFFYRISRGCQNPVESFGNPFVLYIPTPTLHLAAAHAFDAAQFRRRQNVAETAKLSGLDPFSNRFYETQPLRCRMLPQRTILKLKSLRPVYLNHLVYRTVADAVAAGPRGKLVVPSVADAAPYLAIAVSRANGRTHIVFLSEATAAGAGGAVALDGAELSAALPQLFRKRLPRNARFSFVFLVRRRKDGNALARRRIAAGPISVSYKRRVFGVDVGYAVVPSSRSHTTRRDRLPSPLS
ncbi:uncharacterized protein BXZ73DRAFT_77942 [Epithele typhae]|uniref:uncharacterized protein n=1 Tax=Epithele typhae TaxID=378194 RepID=UPI0020086884|nr:uncharacterized protein BXZ73DRAFT_77942 [Epithele typhae]KAH9930508.1 hypothetical protein BXZ73DRAFT_77942 [Epithele typhae]